MDLDKPTEKCKYFNLSRSGDFSGSPVVKTESFRSRGCRTCSILGWITKILHAAGPKE